MIHQLNFFGIKCQKARFLRNKVDLFNINNQLFPIVALYLILLSTVARYDCLFFEVVDVIPTPL